MTTRTTRLAAGTILALVLAIAGCNTEKPYEPSQAVGTQPLLFAISSDGLQFAARVRTTDQTQRMLTFEGQPDTVIANQNCEIVRLQADGEVPVPFSDVKPGDSLRVMGQRQQGRYLYAYRLEVCLENGESGLLAARVRTREESQQMLTFYGTNDTAFAAHNCQIVRYGNDGETPIPFSDIQPMDSVHVYGSRNQNGYVVAYKLKVCLDSNCIYDVAFRDTIAAIDYEAGTFTVKNRTESIQVDDNTIIWGITHRLFGRNGEPNLGKGEPDGKGAGDHGPFGGYEVSNDTVLVFTDLQVGDVVEVRAKIVDANTLLAVIIKVANCGDVVKSCVEFEASLATLDVSARLVTFTDLPWIGWVCNGAKLTDASGEPLLLSDFAVGDQVAVKGFPLAGDTLKICQMVRVTL